MEVKPEQVLSLIKTTSNLPLVKVNREEYLAAEFAPLYPKLVEEILEKGPYEAGVPLEVIEKKAKAALIMKQEKQQQYHLLQDYLEVLL
ncbi:hypothetical protein [uncultured Brachyspira sp.]|uniref:hypothetical protein n=1 Tax=uncultured Brachyspira sp. TaxID=221953 RepID=UPI00263096A4|nr:hypothetical protein [uncultured Brachyspira sp.]